MPEWDNRGRNDHDSRSWNRGRNDNDWNRGRRDRDWDRGWDNDWWKWDKKHKKRRYNHYYGYNDAWWYPYWNQWLAPVVNPIFSWFAPYPTSLPVVARPGVYW
jgi:hypothetical protein